MNKLFDLSGKTIDTNGMTCNLSWFLVNSKCFKIVDLLEAQHLSNKSNEGTIFNAVNIAVPISDPFYEYLTAIKEEKQVWKF